MDLTICPACKQPEVVPRSYETAGGLRFKLQCAACGSPGSKAFVAKDYVAKWVARGNVVVEFDEDHQRRFVEARNERFRQEWAEKRDAENEAWWRRYNLYLKTPRWARKRDAVLRRDGRTCQACLSREATQVHHITYAHVCDEPLFELVSVCKPCHEKITEMDRNGRQTR